MVSPVFIKYGGGGILIVNTVVSVNKTTLEIKV